MSTELKNYKLYGPQHSWDTNYHLLDNEKKIEYLIDIDDVTNDESDEGLYIETLLNLADIEEILTYAWGGKLYISEYRSNLLYGTEKTLEQLLTTN